LVQLEAIEKDDLLEEQVVEQLEREKNAGKGKGNATEAPTPGTYGEGKGR
jgi:hypothetical protein